LVCGLGNVADFFAILLSHDLQFTPINIFIFRRQSVNFLSHRLVICAEELLILLINFMKKE
jgi:hypothetical protein